MKKKVLHKTKKHTARREKSYSISVVRINMYTTGLVFSIALFVFTMWSKQLPTNNTVLGAHTTQPVVISTVTPTPTVLPYVR